MEDTIRKSQVRTLQAFLDKGKAGFTVRQFADKHKIRLPSSRSRITRAFEYGWLKAKEVPGPTSPMWIYTISAEGRKIHKQGLRHWKKLGVDPLSP